MAKITDGRYGKGEQLTECQMAFHMERYYGAGFGDEGNTKCISNLIFLIFIPDNPRLVLFIRTLFYRQHLVHFEPDILIFIPDNPRLVLFIRTLFYRRFTPPFGVRLVALSSYSLQRSIHSSLETGVDGFEEHKVVAVFVYLHDC
ncbi:small subunit processome component 20 [Dorcoceras hygrometricum]|uniref:Small subunit processome component 20 n=1 Tax=Dorcoceras hygrometricum TaxID=472368 RepID=A0A2Z7BPD2_9LAMI|nr:small subunit processome component 20 [Dorcoceras hygrometricum]